MARGGRAGLAARAVVLPPTCPPRALLALITIVPPPRRCPQEHRHELGKDVDLGQYVASGLVVFDLHRRSVKWSQVRRLTRCVRGSAVRCGQYRRQPCARLCLCRTSLLLCLPSCPLLCSTWTCRPTSQSSRRTPTPPPPWRTWMGTASWRLRWAPPWWVGGRRVGVGVRARMLPWSPSLLLGRAGPL